MRRTCSCYKLCLTCIFVCHMSIFIQAYGQSDGLGSDLFAAFFVCQHCPGINLSNEFHQSDSPVISVLRWDEKAAKSEANQLLSFFFKVFSKNIIFSNRFKLWASITDKSLKRWWKPTQAYSCVAVVAAAQHVSLQKSWVAWPAETAAGNRWLCSWGAPQRG